MYIYSGFLIIMFEDKTQEVYNKYIYEYLHSIVILQEISNRISMQKVYIFEAFYTRFLKITTCFQINYYYYFF